MYCWLCANIQVDTEAVYQTKERVTQYGQGNLLPYPQRIGLCEECYQAGDLEEEYEEIEEERRWKRPCS